MKQVIFLVSYIFNRLKIVFCLSLLDVPVTNMVVLVLEKKARIIGIILEKKERNNSRLIANIFLFPSKIQIDIQVFQTIFW